MTCPRCAEGKPSRGGRSWLVAFVVLALAVAGADRVLPRAAPSGLPGPASGGAAVDAAAQSCSKSSPKSSRTLTFAASSAVLPFAVTR